MFKEEMEYFVNGKETIYMLYSNTCNNNGGSNLCHCCQSAGQPQTVSTKFTYCA